MAYPVGDPATLIMLTLPVMPRTSTSFGVVERGDTGAIKFQLVGPERNDWLEWHPEGEQPGDFVGGILDVYKLERSVALGDGWHLVRYKSG
jgi:hypothetical protein